MYCICCGSNGNDPTLVFKTSRLSFKTEVSRIPVEDPCSSLCTFHSNPTYNLEKKESVRALNTAYLVRNHTGEVETGCREQPRPTKESI